MIVQRARVAWKPPTIKTCFALYSMLKYGVEKSRWFVLFYKCFITPLICISFTTASIIVFVFSSLWFLPFLDFSPLVFVFCVLYLFYPHACVYVSVLPAPPWCDSPVSHQIHLCPLNPSGSDSVLSSCLFCFPYGIFSCHLFDVLFSSPHFAYVLLFVFRPACVTSWILFIFEG